MTAEAPVKTKPLVDVKGLRKLFPISRGLFRAPTDFVHAVDGIDFEIAPGESLGLVGESGCGKSTTGRMLVKLLDPTEGQIKFSDGDYEKDVARVGRSEIKDFRSRVQMIFQDPYESMNPRRTVFDTVSEPLAVQGVGTVPEREGRVLELLSLVGLTPAENFLFRYPHELSGGQRQRVAIARALVMNPRFVVADEPTSMLDVSIRISIMELMTDLAERLDVSRQTINAIETGKYDPSLPLALKMARLFAQPVEAIFFDGDSPAGSRVQGFKGSGVH